MGVWPAARLQDSCERRPDAKAITIDDNGIGMSRDEVVDNLGTIAKSGTAAMEQLSGDQKQDSQLIGQLAWVSSSFIVADRVVVVTRKAGERGDSLGSLRARMSLQSVKQSGRARYDHYHPPESGCR